MLFFFTDWEQSSDISETHSGKDKVINKQNYAGTLKSSQDYYYVNREQLSHLLGDLCKFACIWCSFECNSYFDFCHHVKANHRSKFPANLLKGDAENKKSVACIRRKELDLNIKKPSLSKLYFRSKVLPVEPTHEIGDLCIFQCYRCKLRVGNIKGMILHDAKCAGVRKMDDNRFICQYIEEARYHKCRLCDEIFLCDTYLILKHLGQRHSMDITNYMLKIPRQNLPYKLTPVKSYIFNNLILSDSDKDLVPLESITIDVANLCIFKCDNCSAEFHSVRQLRLHLKKCVGNASFKNKYVTQAIFHKCKLCATIMLCDKRPIGGHIKGVHEMSAATYESISIENVTSHYSIQTNAKRKFNYYVSDTLSDKLLVPIVPPLDKPCNPKGSLPDDLLTNKNGNFCLFACDKCNFKTMS